MNMPSIAHFRGISIYMYTERDTPHRLPHFHAYHGEQYGKFRYQSTYLAGRLIASTPNAIGIGLG
jgi:hypothetical protein